VKRAAQAVDSGQRQALYSAPRIASEKFGQGSAGWEIAEAIARSLRMPQFALAGALTALERKARGEMKRIATLEAASAAIAKPGMLRKILARHGLTLVEQHPVLYGAEKLRIADYWMFTRS
jgi:hypothetical protein